MAPPYKGRRIALTVRLPVDLYVQATRAAKRREWSLSHYVAWAVRREMDGRHSTPGKLRGDSRFRGEPSHHHTPGRQRYNDVIDEASDG